jgi:putative membrane-bound dehydrogenase-like protein
MNHTLRQSRLIPVLLQSLLGFTLVSSTEVAGQALELRRGDHICLVGNALGERMQWGNAWETLLYARFPDHELVVRNLCFPGDEPLHRLRSLNFGSPDDHLAHSKADVILFFFGINESFAGERGLPKFAADLTKLVNETKTKDYSGKGPPRIVLVSPIAHEDLGDPNITDGKQHNEDLQRYTEAMRHVAEATGVGFADLFTSTKALFEKSDRNFTLNGVHLSDEGDAAVAPLLSDALFGKSAAAPKIDPRLKGAIAEKNFHWWHRYRAVNGYSIYGTRGEAGSDGTYRNREVMERERAILDQMCANRDRRIWEIAQGQPVPEEIDDSNTLAFITPKTNVGGENDPNRKAGKLGSLEYLPAAEQIKHFKLAPGYEINLFASEEDFPELANPVAMNFDSRGRMWVSAMPSYPQWQPKSKLDDKLLILEDENGDGRADLCKVFAGGLHQPTGFELGYGGAFVAQQPDVLFLKDTDGDDVADVRERRLIGFDSADSHHGLAAFEWGPDGALYFQEGTFKQSQVESPYGLSRLGDAGVWRYDPRTERFGVYVSLSFANPWGHVFDRWGQNFLADASPGFNYWAAPISGRIEHPDKHPGGCRDAHLDFGGPRSDKPYPTFLKMRIRPSSGCEIVSSRHFPPEAQGNFLLNNVIGDLGVLQHTVRDEGSGFTGEEVEPLLLSEHGNCRPVDLQFGPDGALYIVDWHNALIGHLQHNLREPHRDHSHGRIWRVTYKARPLVKPPKIAGETIPALLELLKSPEDRTRYRVRRELAERSAQEVSAAIEAWIAGLDPNDSEYQRLLLEGLWLSQTHNVVNEDLLKRLLSSPDFRARAAATRVLCEWRDRLPDSLELLRDRIHDPHPRVRLEAVRALSFVISPRAIDLALDVLNYEMDVYLEYTLDETIRALEASLGRGGPPLAEAEHAQHDHAREHAAHHQAAPAGPKPLVFFDKNSNIVAYQLNRLSASQLLLIDRSPEDSKSRPVYSAILVRPGVSKQDRAEALAALVQLKGSTEVTEILAAVAQCKLRAPQEELDPVLRQLADLLLHRETGTLRTHAGDFRQAAESESDAVRAVAYAGLAAGRDFNGAWSLASRSEQGKLDFLSGVPLVPDGKARAALREPVLSCLDTSETATVRRAALAALAHIPEAQDDNFRVSARFVDRPAFRAAAVRTLLAISQDQRPADAARQVVDTLVAHAEETPPARRTTDDFLDAMQLTDQLLALLPAAESRPFRERLRAVTVRVVRINTVHEEMRYDTPYFAVEAGRPVQLVLRNEDLMPHNLVIMRAGEMRNVALAAAEMSPQPDARGLVYVPKSEAVLFATRMVDPHRQDALTFTAPSEPGEYPYVCTFPNHWMRMYGVMVVVEDLDAWLASPVKPVDPLGVTREFVQSWTTGDFDNLEIALQGRTPEIGRKIFEEATCLQCHKMAGAGGAVGPELTDVFKRLKEDHGALLREVVDPSHTIDPKYALYNVLLADGRVVAGIVADQNAESITVISNPEKPQPQVIPRDDIDEMAKSSASLMPKGLMDRFTRDEILELLAYLKSGAAAPIGSENR